MPRFAILISLIAAIKYLGLPAPQPNEPTGVALGAISTQLIRLRRYQAGRFVEL
jgi:hypothetical protein